MYTYTHFIPENTAPVGAKSIGVYDGNNKRIGSIPLGGLTPPKESKLYSFCALADVHVYEDTYPTSTEDFQRALTYANANCDFTCIAGDLTSQGSIESQLANYKNIVDTYSPTKPVYAITGNHEHYNGYSDKYLEQYTGYPLYYSFIKGDDVFIMVGHYGSYGSSGWLASEMVSTDELQWLYETLEANRNKRCFVFTHVLPHEHRVGNPSNLYVTAGKPLLWYTNDGGIGHAFMSLLKHYKNTILFHGHSHTRFWLQELDVKANYSSADGYRSVHIPSLSVPRDPNGTSLKDIFAESEGYIVDVYDGYVVLNGRDFIDNDADGHILPIATYKIDTTLVEIPAKTFTDSTGTIKVESLLPTGYQQLDHIESTGTQHLDTGFVPNQDTRVVCEFRYFGGTGIYGARGTTSSKNFAFRLASGNWQPAYGADLGSTGIAADEDWHTAEQDKNLFYLDGSLMYEFESATFTAPKTFILGGINANAKVYYGEGHYRSCKLYDNGTLVRDLIPCTNPDGEIGMYDLVTEAFFGNSGTGSFVAG